MRFGILILLAMLFATAAWPKSTDTLHISSPEIDIPVVLSATSTTLRLRVDASVPDVLVLIAEGMQPDSLIVEYQEQSGKVIRQVSGRRVALHDRSVAMGGTIVRLPSIRDTSVTISIRYVDRIAPMLLIRSIAVHERWVSTRQFVLAILYGLFVFAIVISIVFYGAFRDPSYLWYTAFLLAYLMNMLLSDSRWLVIVMLSPITSSIHIGASMPSISMFLALQFSRSFLELRTLSRRMDRILLGTMMLCFINAVITPTTPMLSYLLFGIAPIMIIIAAVIAIRRGHRYARIFLSAWVILGIATLTTAVFWWSGKSMSPSPIVRAMMTGQLFVHVGGGIEVVLLTLAAAVRLREQRRSEDILRAILPGTVVDRMIHSSERVVDDVPSATVIFCDIVGFTAMANEITSEELIIRLDKTFSIMDDIARRYNIEKIKTIGDAYMAVAGVPIFTPDHADNAIMFALETIRSTRHIVTLRIGIHSGPMIAGVVGSWKFGYDVWGPTVNAASRLEASATPGTILVSAAAVNLTSKHFNFVDMGIVRLRGVGDVHCFSVTEPS